MEPMTVSALCALCPSCPTAVEARTLVFSDAFWTNATYALLPFVVIGFVVHQFVKRLDQGDSRATGSQ